MSIYAAIFAVLFWGTLGAIGYSLYKSYYKKDK